MIWFACSKNVAAWNDNDDWIMLTLGDKWKSKQQQQKTDSESEVLAETIKIKLFSDNDVDVENVTRISHFSFDDNTHQCLRSYTRQYSHSSPHSPSTATSFSHSIIHTATFFCNQHRPTMCFAMRLLVELSRLWMLCIHLHSHPLITCRHWCACTNTTYLIVCVSTNCKKQISRNLVFCFVSHLHELLCV